MNKTITVKGIGKTTAKPDQVTVSMRLESKHKLYAKAMDKSAEDIEAIRNALRTVGFEKDALKTSDFDVCTNYESIRDKHGDYQRVFTGYCVTHDLTLVFAFDMERLAAVLSAIAECTATPRLSIDFTVKNRATVNEELLRSAASNAKRKAEILCDAAGVTLGDLVSIDYDWSELSIVSRTRFSCGGDTDYAVASPKAKAIDIDPEDITASDTAVFVWTVR